MKQKKKNGAEECRTVEEMKPIPSYFEENSLFRSAAKEKSGCHFQIVFSGVSREASFHFCQK